MCIEYKNEHINEEQVVTGEVVVEVIMLWPEQPDTVSRALYVSFTHLLLIRNLILAIVRCALSSYMLFAACFNVILITRIYSSS